MTAQSSHTDMQRLASALRCSHYAVMYIDHSGQLRSEGSPSIAGGEREIFTEEVQGRFLRSVASAWQLNTNNPLGHMSGDEAAATYSSSSSSSSWPHHPTTTRPAGLIPCDLVSLRFKRPRRSLRQTDSASAPGSTSENEQSSETRATILRLGDTETLRHYYERAFDKFQQLNCRVIAKAFIKLVEPRKQVNHPYNGRRTSASASQRMDPELTKPNWWPAGVTHKEPDHLFKPERIKLLVHILCNLKDSKGVTAEKLQEAGQDVKRQIQPTRRQDVLDEIFYVRKMEELYLDGKISGDTTVRVFHAHLADQCHVPELQESTNDSCSAVETIHKSINSHATQFTPDTEKIAEAAERSLDSDHPQRLFQSSDRSPSLSEKGSASPSACFSLSPASSSTVSRAVSLDNSLSKEPADIGGTSKSNRDPGAFRDMQSTVSQSLPEYFAQQVAHPPGGQSATSSYWATLPYNGY
ncbi:DUF2841 domain-containing protein [Aspergillus brunneoviolaceus CBS 621.78]|uniref:Uncharacterized protein n=1 Tax=Aspergillus brunneoviolaceus CBS 621.78 TaxID=1450534 RepID=A0ACD1G4G0_9EURO|nr:hypothetical protein BO95DRAFT_444454 [Aspergillus brunneoviolaceus CBS 621.78]RAH44125.1 hypothetical protein BO95DRAFT_444454 [Aspergillus brunneoviolaceus CBS 621.78]